MGRLIDVDDVISLLVNHHFDDDKENFDLLIHNLCKEIRQIPTAYDVDAVVKRLNAIKDTDVCEKLNCDVCLYSKKCSATTDQSFNLKWDRIVEIVKGGGVDAKTDS